MSRLRTEAASSINRKPCHNMNPDLSEHAVKTIEAVCERGCGEVNQLIEDAKNGREIEILKNFSETETNMIIEELVGIMAVYDQDKC